MWIPVVSTAAALCGVVIGQLIARSNEYRKWLRTEQHVSCARLLEAGEALRTQKAMETVAHFVALEQAQQFLTNSSDVLETLRKAAEDQLGRTIEKAEIDALVPRVAEALVKIPEAGSKIRQAVNDRLGLDEKSFFAGTSAAVERMRTAMESVRLVCSAEIVSSGDSLIRAAINLSSRNEEWEETNKEYNESRVEFVRLVRGHFVDRTLRFGRR